MMWLDVAVLTGILAMAAFAGTEILLAQRHAPRLVAKRAGGAPARRTTARGRHDRAKGP